MKYLSTFEGFVHYGYGTKTDCIVDPLIDLRDYVYNETPESAEYVSKYLRSKKDCLIKVYHGTSPELNILGDGLKTTKNKTKRSLQSQSGFVYFSIYPDSAKMFGDMGYGINNAQVYECLVPIKYILPDKDQLYNMRVYGEKDIPDNIGFSIVYGHGIRIKGDIPPYMIKKYNNS